jgi:beta-1,4-galactosyltransferase 1
VAIIVPYRNRYKNLKAFLRYMHTYMMRKQLEYGIYLIEPSGELIFNRALLINIGYKEALKDYPDWNCFVFHDVDLLPESDENLYECHSQFPRQYAITISIYNYT